MNLDEEMKLWEERANDVFGQILKKIAKATKDYLYSWEEMGIEYNVLSEYKGKKIIPYLQRIWQKDGCLEKK